ncbi:hypothetical protein BBP40_011860 [Aspergillus hancockii]|nr:hypothetical protein BBP40_011860 [Aspergillus hancockii]
MSGFGRRSNEGHGSYIMNQQIALPTPYSQGEGHEFSVNDSGSYHFPAQSFSSYTSPFGSPYNHSGISPHSQHLSPHHSPGHPAPSNPEHTTLQHHHHNHHQPVQYMPPSRYLQSPRYLPFREALGETDIESQDSRNQSTMLSEPVVPPLDGFPN